MKTKHGWWTYRLYCPDGCLAYVGMTNDLHQRMRQHAYAGRVFKEFRARLHRSQRGARVDEAILIIAVQPPWNGERYPTYMSGFSGPAHKGAKPCPHGWSA